MWKGFKPSKYISLFVKILNQDWPKVYPFFWDIISNCNYYNRFVHICMLCSHISHLVFKINRPLWSIELITFVCILKPWFLILSNVCVSVRSIVVTCYQREVYILLCSKVIYLKDKHLESFSWRLFISTLSHVYGARNK